ncbi:MAG: DUF411 domain-containing protein [Betaproteobacteria bacterium]|nr:DUF411 domain-containing protein [Betaproteobacteria bacterium]
MDRRTMLRMAAAGAASVAFPALAAALPGVRVFKSPTCGCCTGWVDHLREQGFTVAVEDVGNAAARARLGISDKLGSCHTAEVAGYAIEGHVPAPDIKRLLASRPRARGLAVPGMPIGSPGMESGGRRDAYDVLLVRTDGSTSVFASYPAAPPRKTT